MSVKKNKNNRAHDNEIQKNKALEAKTRGRGGWIGKTSEQNPDDVCGLMKMDSGKLSIVHNLLILFRMNEECMQVMMHLVKKVNVVNSCAAIFVIF